jgi:hypothetical protein
VFREGTVVEAKEIEKVAEEFLVQECKLQENDFELRAKDINATLLQTAFAGPRVDFNIDIIIDKETEKLPMVLIFDDDKNTDLIEINTDSIKTKDQLCEQLFQ